MAARKRSLKPSISGLARELAESWINGNRQFVVSEIGRLRSQYAAVVAVKVYDLLYKGDDTYDASSFTRALEAATY